jgi:ATP-binding cassette subfamily B multidrug efflux pump
MAIAREEEKLGAYTLFRHFLRIMSNVRGQRWLLVVCVVGSMTQAAIELSLPLLTRRGIDVYVLPPYMRVDVSNPSDREWLSAKPGAVKAEGDDSHLFVKAADLSRAEQAEVRVRKLAGSERYFYVPPTGGALEGRFLGDAELKTMKAGERRNFLTAERAGVARLALAYFILLLLNFAFSYSVTYGLNVLGERAVMIMRARLFRHLHRLPIRYFDENPVGRLVTRVTNDTATLSELFTDVVATAVSDVALFAGILVVLFTLSGPLAWRLLLLAPPLVLLALWFKMVSQKIYRVIRVQLARINTFLQETVQGMVILKTFVAERRTAARFAELGEAYYKTQMRLIYVFAVFRPLIDAFATSAVAIVVWYGGGEIVRGQLTIGTLVAFLIYLKMLFMPLQDLADKFNIVQSSVVASERLFKILDVPAEDQGRGVVPDQPCGHIVFDKVSFAYEEGQPVLKDVSFEVPCGQTAAIVGPTGAGKSTITSLLLRFYPLKAGQGRILVDGVPIEDWDVRALRRQFAFVQQDLFLFAGSLGRNITLYNDVNQEDLQRSLSVSRADRVVNKLPEGLDHALNERGTTLSQGERQLISFARALAPGPKILVLDEATASVDSQTEALVQQALDELLQGRTAVVVAHRLSTVQDAHKIVVLSHGAVEEEGTHAELLAKGGLYARLYNTQFRARDKTFEGAR